MIRVGRCIYYTVGLDLSIIMAGNVGRPCEQSKLRCPWIGAKHRPSHLFLSLIASIRRCALARYLDFFLAIFMAGFGLNFLPKDDIAHPLLLPAA